MSREYYWFVNPSTIFGQNRQLYYDSLAKADGGTEEGILVWCEYFLIGVLSQFQKNLQLGNKEFINSKILFPALEWMRKKAKENDRTINLLKFIIDNDYKIKSDDLNNFFEKPESAVFRSRILKSLVEKKYLKKDTQNSRLYMLSLQNIIFRKAVIYELAENDIIDKSFQNEL
jgi:Fic family protein